MGTDRVTIKLDWKAQLFILILLLTPFLTLVAFLLGQRQGRKKLNYWSVLQAPPSGELRVEKPCP